MIFLLALKAFLLGLVVAAPVGPVGALVIRRTLRTSAVVGTATGLGAGLADTFFAIIACFGISSVESLVNHYSRELSIGGGVVLIAWGLVALMRNFQKRADPTLEPISPELELQDKEFQRHNPKSLSSLARAAGGSFLITLSNPVTIVGFATAFAALHILPGEYPAGYSIVVAGVFLGSACWWFFLAQLVRWLRKRLSKSLIFYTQVGTDGIILVSGILCLMRGLLSR